MEKDTIACCVEGCNGKMTIERNTKEENGKLVSQNIYTCQKCGYVQPGGISTTGFVDQKNL